MKLLISTTLLASGLLLAACSNNKTEQQKKMDEVMALHDKVMDHDELAIKNKTQLDSLAKVPALVARRDSMLILSKELGTADSAMGEWMNKFNPDFKDKSDDEAMAYLEAQKKQIIEINQQFTKAVSQSNTLLSQIKK